jgi:hypothetical protein
VKAMALAPASQAKGQVPNFCEPQPTITIYVTGEKSSTQYDLPICRKALSGHASTGGDLATESTPGPELPKFIFHKNLISHHSPFFSAAFNSIFKEGISQEMTLEADLKVFGVFSNWLYSQTIFDASGERPGLCTLAHLWMLADRFLIPKLQNEVVDILHNMVLNGRRKIVEFGEFCNIVHEYAEGDNPLVRLAAEVLTWTPHGSLDLYLDLIPRSVFLKSWQSLKKLQVATTGLPHVNAFYVKEN